MNSFNITIKLSTLYEFISYGNYKPLMTKYTIALASCCAVHYNDRLAIVFNCEIEIFAKNNSLIYIFFRRIYSHNSEAYTLDKRSYLCLRPFNCTIIFHDNKKNCTHPCKFTSVTLPYAKVNTTKTKQYSI